MSTENPLKIDEHNLDAHWVEQAELYYSYALQLASYRLTLQQAHQEMELTKAELDAAIRENPVAYDLPKVTEGAVAAAILQQAPYQKAQKAWNAAKYQVDVCAAMVEALNHKRKALEKLVDLHLTNYFSQPKERTGATRPVEDDMVGRALRARQRKAAEAEYEEREKDA